jgi:hypothetical protein
MTCITWRVAARTAGSPRRLPSFAITPCGVSFGRTIRVAAPSAQVEAFTASVLDLVS